MSDLMAILDPLRRSLQRLRLARRRAWAGVERSYVEVRSHAPEQVAELAGRIADELGALPGVRWARLNSALGRVVVEVGPGGPDLDALRTATSRAEAAAGLGRQPFSTEPRTLPWDNTADLRLLAEIAADILALLAGLVRRRHDDAVDIDIAAALRAMEEVPPIRRALDDWLGVASADLLLGLANATTSASMRGTVGPATDLVWRMLRLRSVWAVRRAWEAREGELGGSPDHHDSGGAERRGERNGELPEGPIESYADGAILAALGGFGIGVASTRRFESAAGALLGGIPKPAHQGRKAFAAALAEQLAAAGFLVLDPQVLRRLDRIDLVVVQGELLAATHGEIVQIQPVDGVDGASGSDATTLHEQEVRQRTAALFDATRPFDVQLDGAWALGPLSTLQIVIDASITEPLRASAAPGGRLLGLAEQGRLRAIVAIRPELDEAAEALLSAIRAERLGLAIVSDHPHAVAWLQPEHILPEGRGLVTELRVLQAARGLCVIWRGDGPALLEADVGVGLPAPGDVPWRAHVIAPRGDPRLDLFLASVGAARRIAKQSVQIATLEAVAGMAISLQGPSAPTSRRVMTVSSLASLLAMANGVRVARGVVAPARKPRRDHTPWHALDVDVVLERLVSGRGGLAATVAASRRRPPPPRPSDWEEISRIMTHELDNPLAPLLATGAALSALTGSTTDAVMVGSVLALNGLIGGTQQVRAERALAELDRQEARRVRTLRDGVWATVLPEDLVRGDVVALLAGETVPADLRVVQASALEVDESALTGESVPASKFAAPSYASHVADRSSMLFAGTTIAAGDAVGVVVATGEETEARAEGGVHRVSRGVEARLEALSGFTAPIAALAGLIMLVSGLARRGKPGELVSTAVALSVAAVPEGLPLLAMLAQLAAARRLAARGALVRNPRAIEALGRVDVLCADKTGTLTEGRLRLVQVGDPTVDRPIGELEATQHAALRIALRATPAPAAGETLPHPTDQAIVEGAAAASLSDVVRRLEELPFEPKRGWHATLVEEDGRIRLAVKGSPEAVLARCTQVAHGEGERRLRVGEREALLARAEALAAQGLRVLAVADRGTRAGPLTPERVERLVLRGFLGIADPPRPSAVAAVAALRRAGVAVKMITGDHPATARAIGAQLGLSSVVITGAELDLLDDVALDARVDEVELFARVTPAQKVRLVRALRRNGRVVAMTGDGANDAPAIREADVGVALGERATTAARHAAAVVVADGRVETIVDALLEGRALWASVRDAVGVLVGSNLGEIAYTLTTGLAAGRAPLNARQLLLVNLLTDALPALTLAVRPPGSRTPEELTLAGPDASLGAALERDIAWRAVVTGVSAGAAWGMARVTSGPRHADSVGLVALVGTQLGQTLLLADRSRDVVLASVGSMAALLAIVQIPPVSRFFGCQPLGVVGLGQATVVSGLGTLASAALPAVFQGAVDRASELWTRHEIGESDAVRLVTESRTLRRLLDRGARLRDRTRAEHEEEG